MMRCGLLFLLLVAACNTLSTESVEEATRRLVFRPGVTTKEEVLLQLGMPAATYEGERILTWWVTFSNEGRLTVRSSLVRPVRPSGATEFALASHSLILVFDGNHVLTRQALVPVR